MNQTIGSRGRDKQETGIRALTKGLEILSLFTVERPECTLAEIVDETKFPRPTAYRLVHTLQEAQYLKVDSAGSRYHLGPAIIPALYLLKDHSSLVKLLHGQLRDLAEKAGEHASLATEIDGAAVIIDAVPSSYNPFQPVVPVGRVQGGLSTAHSKVLNAFKKGTELAAMLAESQPARTPHTVTDPGALAAEMGRIAREGVAFDVEEHWLRVCGVAAPVRDKSGAVVASVSLVVSVERFGAERRRLLADTVRASAEAMSAALGCGEAGDRCQ